MEKEKYDYDTIYDFINESLEKDGSEEDVIYIGISADFDNFYSNGQFYHPLDLKDVVDGSVKKYGLASNMIRLATPIVNYRGSADFLKVNAHMNDFEEYSSVKLLNEFFESYSPEQMKDEKFAEQAYDLAQYFLTKDEFKEFVNLRKPYKDGFCPENEHAPERER